MGACPTLHTERLELRPFREDDLDAYHAVMDAAPRLLGPRLRHRGRCGRHRLGLRWVEDRTMAWFPSARLGIWRRRRGGG